MTYDPTEFMDDAELNDFQVRQHLYAQRRLAELDTVDTRARVEKMLAETPVGPKVCGMAVTEGGVEGEKAKRTICGKVGVRLVRLSGTYTCRDHDPLRHGETPTCCVRNDEEMRICEDQDGPWVCSAGIEGHGWPHRHSILGG